MESSTDRRSERPAAPSCLIARADYQQSGIALVTLSADSIVH
jgi:hypothetical protein